MLRAPFFLCGFAAQKERCAQHVRFEAPFCSVPEGCCSQNRIFMDHNEKRDLISRALGAQIPNPGSFRSRAEREIFDFCCPPPAPPWGGVSWRADGRQAAESSGSTNSRRHRKDFRKWSPTPAREIAFLWTKMRSET